MSPSSSWRDRIALILLLLSALGALVPFATGIASVSSAAPSTKVVETWRMYGFLVFAGLFLLLVLRPRYYAGVWELVIFHKAAVAITAAIEMASGAAGAASVALVDGVLAVLLLVAYLLARGYTAWATFRTA